MDQRTEPAGLSAALAEGEEFIGRLRYFNEVLGGMRGVLALTDEERESCLRAEREMAAALAEGRAASARLAEAEAVLRAASVAVLGAKEECRTTRQRAEAAATAVAAAIEARPEVRPSLRGGLIDVLRGGVIEGNAAAPSPRTVGAPVRRSARGVAKAVFNTFFSITTAAAEESAKGGKDGAAPTPAAA